jgi:hypothetical protein
MEQQPKLQRELESLIRKLDRKVIVPWLPGMRLGRPVYNHLLGKVRANELNRNQTANALHALFRLRLHGSEEEIFALLLDFSRHPDKRVRSEAVDLLMRMVRVHKSQSPFQPSTCMQEIKEALELGLEHNVAFHAQRFLADQA